MVAGPGPGSLAVAAASGPDWASIMTAFGTVGAVVAAVGIALWSEWRMGERLKAERIYSEKKLAEERALSAAEIKEERRVGREREQLVEAYAVQVALAEKRTPGESLGDTKVKVLAALVVNRGRYTISRVEVQFSLNPGSLITARRQARLPDFEKFPDVLRAGWGQNLGPAMQGILTPWDAGIRFETDGIHVQHLGSPYPVVRWMDQWATWWEHRRDEVRQIAEGEPWMP